VIRSDARKANLNLLVRQTSSDFLVGLKGDRSRMDRLILASSAFGTLLHK